MSSLPKHYLTPEEYLKIERASEGRHEYYVGEMFLMSGASLEHTLINNNIAAELHSQLKRTPCRVLSNDMRVLVRRTGLFTYPDTLVVCGEPKLVEDGHFDTLLNPTLIVEVLSLSTERYDRGKKFDSYQTIEALAEYVLVAQDEPRVERFARVEGSGGAWHYTAARTLEDSVELASINCRLLLADVYANVTFPPNESLAPPSTAIS